MEGNTENILVKMTQVKDLSPSERHVLDYVLANYRDVCNMGIVELGEKTFTSTTTVKRLCRKLGVESYTSFRMLLSAAGDGYAYREDIAEDQFSLGRCASAAEALEKVSRRNAALIQQTARLIDPQTLEQVVARMAQARRIDFYGVGASHAVALDAQMKCMRLRIPSTAFSDRLSMLTGAEAYAEGALAFLISHTGETDDMVELARVLCRCKVPTVAIISAGSGALSGLCLYCLRVDSEEGEGGMASPIAAMHVIDVLFAALRGTNYERYSNYIAQTAVNNRIT